MMWVGYVARMGEEVKPKGKRPLWRLMHKWKNGIRMGLGGDWLCEGWSGLNWLRIGAGGRLLWMRWWTFQFWRHGVICAVLFFWLNHFKMAELQTCEVGAKPASVSLELSRVKKFSLLWCSAM
jgi:hypothetical protein